MLSALSAVGADYLLVGAYALAAHGHPRATGDLDIWIRPEPENALKVYRTLAEFGAPLHDLTIDDLVTPGMVFQIGVEPCRIDILTTISGVQFSTAWEQKMAIEIDGLRLYVIGRADLLINKRACGRPKDIADADTLARRDN